MDVVNPLTAYPIGAQVEDPLAKDWSAEAGAVKDYNGDIKLAAELGDNGTRELLESILKDEEGHLDWLEAQLDQIEQMGAGARRLDLRRDRR